ncbi:MAG: hypothetical protein Q4Q58_04700 [Thermoplasmata archaeon]|nr:hypothetical protein [Thermoplasmata archaeon]
MAESILSALFPATSSTSPRVNSPFMEVRPSASTSIFSSRSDACSYLKTIVE